MRPRATTEAEYQWMRDRVRTGGLLPPKRKRVVPYGASAASSPFAPYRSKWELNFSKVLELEQQARAIKRWAYEGMTLKLAKGKYHRIDFLIWHNDRSIEIAQIKGYHPNLRDAMTHLTWAAQLNPWFIWTIKWWTGTGWDSKYVTY